MGVVGRYILTAGVFSRLERVRAGAGGEIQLTDAIADMLAEEPVFAYHFEGRRFDCGSKLGYLAATVNFGLKHPEVGDSFGALLSRREATQAESLGQRAVSTGAVALQSL
jgi:UTP--glucose-1-phosphate uridylyltransferase